MYQLGRKPKQKRSKWPLYIGLIIVAVVGALSWWVWNSYLKPEPQITQSPAVTRQVTTGASATKAFDETGFEINLPIDWKLVSHTTQPYNLYRYQGTTKTSTSRILDVYQDVMPAEYAVNRVQTIEANGSQLSVTGNVSDNCASFTKAESTPGRTGTLAKWQGNDFLCDLDNTQRNVIGTISADGINQISLTGATGGKHKFFFAYTDNAINPNYTTFYDALASFNAK